MKRIVAMADEGDGYGACHVAPLFDARLVHVFLSAALGGMTGVLAGVILYGALAAGGLWP